MEEDPRLGRTQHFEGTERSPLGSAEAMLGDDIGGSNGLWKAGELLSGEGLALHNFLFENTAWVIMSKQSKSGGDEEPVESPAGRSCFNNTFDRWLFLKAKLFSSNYRSLHKHKNFTVPKI